MYSPHRIFFASIVLSAGVGACSGTASDSPAPAESGGAAVASGGAAVVAGAPSANGGAVASAGSAPAAEAGSGTSVAGSGVGGSGPEGSAGSGASMAGSAAGGSPAAHGGSTASGGAGPITGTGGKVDQNSLPAITIHLAGDSTMANYAASTTQEGWGQEFGQFFIAKVSIDNQALGGANVDSFYTSRWKTIVTNTKAGDFVLAAFGINDSGTAHGPVAPPAFQARFSQMADEIAAKKATFIITTSSPLQVWVSGKETNARLQPYSDVMIALGKSKPLPVDDLNARGIEYYNMIGQTAAAALTFNGDKAHFNKAGAVAMAKLAAQELVRIGSPLAAYLK